MLQTQARKIILGAAVVIAAVLGSAGTAQAKTYPGSFTPPFGAPFSDLEWSGTGDFFIPNACEAGPSGWHANFGSPCGGQTITNGTLRFHSISDGASTAFDEVFTFNLPTVNAMYTAGGELRGVDSEFIGQFVSTKFNTVGSDPVWFWLKFEHEIATGPNRSVVQLYFNGQGEGSSCLISKDCAVFGESHTKAILVLVPEPATYALMLGGLLAVGAIARRQKR